MTITRHQLPGDAWADLRDTADVSERLRRPIKAIQMKLARDPAFAGVVAKAKADGVASMADIDETEAADMATAIGEESLALMDDLSDRLILSRVAGWSFGPEVTADALLDLPGGAYDALKELCAEDGLQAGPDFAPSTDPASPTGPSTV
ncbi:hypothetical protein [Streptomyces sioyaensis]|uniref:hypothetical protein n=1 Tax=Streptomyces sioyaensis TaxID=67364 RepID=UPI0037B3EF39